MGVQGLFSEIQTVQEERPQTFMTDFLSLRWLDRRNFPSQAQFGGRGSTSHRVERKGLAIGWQEEPVSHRQAIFKPKGGGMSLSPFLGGNHHIQAVMQLSVPERQGSSEGGVQWIGSWRVGRAAFGPLAISSRRGTKAP